MSAAADQGDYSVPPGNESYQIAERIFARGLERCRGRVRGLMDAIEKLPSRGASKSSPLKFSIVAICLAAAGAAILPRARAQAPHQAPAAKTSMKLPLRFQASHGQTDGQIKYVARSRGYSIFLARDEADIVLHHEADPAGPVARGKVIIVRAYANVLRLRFADSNLPTEIVPLALHSAIRGASPSAYTAVAYRDIYPGTDVIFHGDQQRRRIGLDLNLSPGADPGGVVLEFDGATGIILDAQGNAVVRVGDASLLLERPVVFENRNGRHRPVPAAYQIEPNNRLRFLVALPRSTEHIVTD